MIFFLDESNHRQDVKIAKSIGEMWKHEITNGKGIYWNCNAKKKHFEKNERIATGKIKHDDQKLRENLNLYNAAVERYNLAVAGKTLSEEEHTALKNQLDAEKKLFEQRQKALEQYESTLDVVRDTTDNIQENARSIADKKLEEIKFKMEIVLDVKSMKDAVMEA